MASYRLSQSVSKVVDPTMSPDEVSERLTSLGKTRINLSPLAVSALNPNSFSPAKRTNEELKGTIGLVDISKINGNHFLARVRTRYENILIIINNFYSYFYSYSLEKEFPLLTVKQYMKPTFSRPAPDSLRSKIIDECDFVIQGLAD